MGLSAQPRKRPVSSDEINMVVNRIEQKLRGRNENEIQSEEYWFTGHGGVG